MSCGNDDLCCGADGVDEDVDDGDGGLNDAFDFGIADLLLLFLFAPGIRTKQLVFKISRK